MQWRWKRAVVEQVLLTALKVYLTAQDIRSVVTRHWGNGQDRPRKDDHERKHG